MQSTRLGQGAKFFRAEELRDGHGRLQPAPPIVLGAMATPGTAAPGTAAAASHLQKLTELAKKPLNVQVSSGVQVGFTEGWYPGVVVLLISTGAQDEEGRFHQLLEAACVVVLTQVMTDDILVIVDNGGGWCVVAAAAGDLGDSL